MFFILKAIWRREDISQYSMINKKSLIGAFFMKFILADNFLCINKNGSLYASSKKTEECLWLSKSEKFVSAVYSNVNIAIKKNCKLNVAQNNMNFNEIEDSREECREKFRITSGFSPQLQKFYQSCQSSLQNYQNQNLTKNSTASFSSQIKKATDLNEKGLNSKKEFHTNPNTSRKKFQRKCYQFRKTPKYKECMKRHYKCFKFRKDPIKFKNCRRSLAKN